MLLPGSWTFLHRLAALFVVLSAIALWDAGRRGARAHRWREYLFLFAAGGLAATFGALVDSVTSGVSADYFIIGKGIEPGPGFRLRAVFVGAQAGFVAGVVLASVMLLANQARGPGSKPRLPLGALLRRTSLVFVCAAVGGALLGLLAAVCRPTWFHDALDGVLDGAAEDRFVTVFGTHLGVYLGALVGSVVCIRSIRRRRRQAGAAPADPIP